MLEKVRKGLHGTPIVVLEPRLQYLLSIHVIVEIAKSQRMGSLAFVKRGECHRRQEEAAYPTVHLQVTTGSGV